MDYTPDLLAFRSVLTSLNNVHPFCKINSRAGNEEKLNHIIEAVSIFLKDRKLFDDKGNVQGNITEIKKISLFIVLNSDLAALEEMVNNEHIDSIIWAIPTIPKFLMTYMILKLRLLRPLYDMISFCSPQLSVQVSAAVLENIKWMNPDESLAVLLNLGSAVYHLICRLHFFKLDNDVLSDILTSSFNSTQLCLNFFTSPPNAEKLEKLKKDAEYQYKGERLAVMLSLLQKDVNIYISNETFVSQGFDEIYALTYKPKGYDCNDLNFETGNTPDKVIGEYLDKCLLISLDKCMELVMDVSVDIYCAWSEFRKDGQEMQRIIGDQSYKLCSDLLNTKTFAEHPVLEMLQQISRKPEEVRDVINDTDTNAIVENIMKTDGSQSEWVQALLYKEGLMDDPTLIAQLTLNINLISSEDAYKLYKMCKENLPALDENTSHVKLLAVKAFQRCSTTEKYEILQNNFTDHFNNYFETEDFINMMTEVFNKILNSQNEDLSDVLCIFLQNPKKVYEKIISCATNSSEQGHDMVKVLESINVYSKHKYLSEPSVSCLYNLVKDFFFKLDTDVRQRNFISFVCNMKECACITDEELLHVIIMPNLHKALLNKNMRVVNVTCKILYDGISLNTLRECKTPMLAMLAQVLDVARWSIDTFHADRVSIIITVVLLQNTLIGFYSGEIPDNESEWLQSKLSDVHPLNRYYYKDLWESRSSNSFIEEAGGPDEDEKTDKLIIWLAKVLCQTTSPEWHLIWESLDYIIDEKLEIFSTVVHVLLASEKMARKGNTWNCMLYVFENYVSLLRYQYLLAIEEPYIEVSHAIDKLAYVIKAVEEENLKSIQAVFMPLVAYLVEREKDYKMDVRDMLRSKLNLQDIASNGN